MKFNIPALDVTAANEGKYFHFKNGFNCKIARFNNPAHANRYIKLLENHKGEDDSTDLVNEVAELMMKTILLDWNGLTDGDEENPQEIPYSFETGMELLTDEQYTEFQSFVELTSRRMENYYIVDSAKAVK